MLLRGPQLIVQGEAHKQHGQIGKVAPAKLLFSDLQYRSSATGSWPLLNVSEYVVDTPYGWDEPAGGQMRVWTANAH